MMVSILKSTCTAKRFKGDTNRKLTVRFSSNMQVTVVHVCTLSMQLITRLLHRKTAPEAFMMSICIQLYQPRFVDIVFVSVGAL